MAGVADPRDISHIAPAPSLELPRSAWATPRRATLRHATPRYATPCHATPRHAADAPGPARPLPVKYSRVKWPSRTGRSLHRRVTAPLRRQQRAAPPGPLRYNVRAIRYIDCHGPLLCYQQSVIAGQNNEAWSAAADSRSANGQQAITGCQRSSNFQVKDCPQHVSARFKHNNHLQQLSIRTCSWQAFSKLRMFTKLNYRATMSIIGPKLLENVSFDAGASDG